MTAGNQPEFVEHASRERGFRAYFDSEIAPLLQDLEEHRLTVLRSIRRRRLFAILFSFGFAASVGILILEPFRGDFLHILPMLMLMAASGMWIAVIVAGKAYQKNRKSVLMPVVLGFFGRFRYAVKGQVPTGPLQHDDLYPGWNRADLADEISGHYQGRDFVLAELRLTREVRKEHRNHTTKRVWPVFRGLLIRFELTRPPDDRVMRDIDSLVSRIWPDEYKYAIIDEALWLAIPCVRNHFEPGPITETALQTDDIRQMLADTAEVLDLIQAIAARLDHAEKSAGSVWQSENRY